MQSKKQILTMSVTCTQECPADLPDTCLECPLFHQAQTNVIEVLADARCADEAPPAANKLGQLPEEQVEAAKM